jgi:hypothetical protein
MATTTDVTITSDGTWQQVDKGASYVHVAYVRNNKVSVRVGTGGNSEGVVLGEGDQLRADDNIFVKVIGPYGLDAVITVVKD